jgi:hypothetical protein
VLGAQVHRKPSEPLLEVPSPPTADDVHVRGRKRCERTQECADLRGRLRKIRVDLELAQRSVVVEQDRPRASACESAAKPRLELRIDSRRAACAAVALRGAPQAREEALRRLSSDSTRLAIVSSRR